MTRVNCKDGWTADVVEGLTRYGSRGVSSSFRSRHSLVGTIVMLLLCAMMLPLPSYADESKPAPQPSSSAGATSGITVTNNITDTENLLGDRASAVSDAIAATKKSTGVTVKLLYLKTFGNPGKPEAWASDVLESTHPARNTVMLAVASDDGNLVVVVSSNSEEWLKSKKTADLLSDAALKPIEKDTPDWPGSAIAMMNEIDTINQTSTSTRTTRIGAIVLVSVLAVLILVVVLVLVLRRKGVVIRRRRDGKHASHKRTA